VYQYQKHVITEVQNTTRACTNAPIQQYQKHVITEVQNTTRACTNAPRRTPSGTSSLVYSA